MILAMFSVCDQQSNRCLITCPSPNIAGSNGITNGITTASMAEWLRAWDTLATMKLWRREVVSSIPDRGTIVG